MLNRNNAHCYRRCHNDVGEQVIDGVEIVNPIATKTISKTKMLVNHKNSNNILYLCLILLFCTPKSRLIFGAAKAGI